jgi:hypothetical protein
MAFDKSKVIELYLLKAENFKEDIAPNQKKYYLDVVKWLEENEFESEYHMTEAMKNTEYYEGGAIAKTADDIQLRINAMTEVGYEDAADIHRVRQQKFKTRGNAYAFSQEWLDDYKEVADECEKYARRKEIFGKIFSAYFQIAGNPQSEYRKEAVQDISAGLQELANLGVTFDELASDKVYKNLTMTTEKGMENFVSFIHAFIAGDNRSDDISDIKEEQQELAEWIKVHKAEVMAAGINETWNDACAIAVPSDAEGGYDFIAIKEVAK